MKNFLAIIIMAILLSSCGPSPAQIEKAIEQTQTAQPTNTNTPEPTATATAEPTATATPEYCELTEYITALEKIFDVLDGFNDQNSIILELAKDQSLIGEVTEEKLLGWTDVRVELTKLQRDLDVIDVPECLVYLKQILAEVLSDSISMSANGQVGLWSQVFLSMNSVSTNLKIFVDEIERLNACLPDCKP